jgi:hypothetical protein
MIEKRSKCNSLEKKRKNSQISISIETKALDGELN